LELVVEISGESKEETDILQLVSQHYRGWHQAGREAIGPFDHAQPGLFG